MSNIERFEDIEAWEKARSLVKGVYQTTGEGKFAKDFSLKDQIRRAAVSIISNIVHPVKYVGWGVISQGKGFSRQTDRESVQFLHVVHPVKYMRRFLFHGAGGSTSEVKSQLYVALDLRYINQEEFDNLYKQADEVGRLIFGFIRYLRKAL